MKNNDNNTTISDDIRSHNIKYSLSKHDDDLYHEEDDIEMSVLRIKYVRGDKWKMIDEHNKVVFTLDGAKLNKNERIFLRSVDGFNFLMAEFRRGFRSFNTLKLALKKKMKLIKKT